MTIPLTQKRLLSSGLWILLASLVTLPALAQDSRDIEIGTMSYFTREIPDQDDILYPRGVNHVDTEMIDTYGITIGTRRTWTGPDGQTNDFQVAQVMHNKFSNIEVVTIPESGAFERVFRNPYARKVLDGQEWTRQFDQQDPVDGSLPADAVLYSKFNLWPDFGMGMDAERWVYAFAHDEYDDMVILELRVTNNSGEVREDVYIGLNGGFGSDAHYPGDLWGNYEGVTYPDYLNGDATADSMRVWYAWRADMTRTAEDDKGDPNAQWGNFQEPQFMANLVLHADTSPSDETDDPNQPQKAGWSQRDFVANLNEVDQPTTYQYLAGPWNTGDNPYDTYLDADGNVVDPNSGEDVYRVMSNPDDLIAPAWVDANGFDPELEQEKNNLMSFGPYQMQPGEDVRIVMAIAGGTIPSRLNIDAGRAYDSGHAARQTFGINPLPCGLSYTDMHGNPVVQNGDVYDTDGNLIANCGQTLTRDQKDAIINMGLDLALTTASKARLMWEDSDVQYGTGSFAPRAFAPASPSLTGFSENDQVRLTWTDNQQDPRGGPIVGYKIYREYNRPSSVTSPTDTTFLEIADLPAGTTEYIDTEVVRGENYYYYIAAYNADGVESSAFQNRTGTSATKEDEALAATRPPSAAWQDEVVVVPNPYHVQAAQKYPGRRLNFLNLPAYANIHIYNITGDRVQTLEHDASTGDRDWLRQDTFSTVEIVSGVYIYVVEELDGPRGNATGETAIGKFVVIK